MVTDEDTERRIRFGKALKSQMGMTQQVLANRLGYSQSTISAWIGGRKAPRTRGAVTPIERAIGVPLGSLSNILFGSAPEPDGAPTPEDLLLRIAELAHEARRLLATRQAGKPSSGGTPTARALRDARPRSSRTDIPGKRQDSRSAGLP